MDFSYILELIGSVGFPIAVCLVLGWFVWTIYKDQKASNAKLMDEMQTRCAAREERLNEQITKSQEVNAQAIATIALYSERLGIVEQDVKEIKQDVNVIVNKLNT